VSRFTAYVEVALEAADEERAAESAWEIVEALKDDKRVLDVRVAEVER
jgi:hypothetical protein